MSVTPVRSKALQLDSLHVELHVSGNLIYTRLSGVFTDAAVLLLLGHIEAEVDQIPGANIRILDAAALGPGDLRLTSQVVQEASSWSARIMKKRPGSVTYAVSGSAVAYGTARMYSLMAELYGSAVVPLRSISEVPVDVLERLAAMPGVLDASSSTDPQP